MKKNYNKLLLILCLLFYGSNFVMAANLDEAEKLIKKAKLARNQEESYEYVHKARVLYEDEYEVNPTNIQVLLGLSKVNQMLEDRANAKLYILKAYNIQPTDPKLQKEMGDFYYNL